MQLAMVFLVAVASVGSLPEIRVDSDDVLVTQSCRLVIDPNAVIKDSNENGVIHVRASEITLEFAETSALRGAAAGARPDEYRGYGIRIEGQKHVTIRGGRISGFWCGIYANDADGLTIEDVDASDMRRAYLKSTPAAEDGGDWLWPHNNDANEWLQNYGAAFCLEDLKDATVRNCKVWHSQNALILDRVTDSKIYDNDFSFNSGWGVAMWRASRNVISRNALDFCVRGYSHGVYNRGQDSAGFLVFEQCNKNVLAENSATHGGDAFFGFGGKEALGQTPAPTSDFDYKRIGCNDNLLIGNDFSYAPAHGIEMTFSFGNKYIGNRLVGNAICGVWGGYSQETLIANNTFESNGEMGYGLERGGVNIEYGVGNQVLNNTFKGDRCGVHYWVNATSDLAKSPWGLANKPASRDNLIAHNTFAKEDVAFHFRGPVEVALFDNKVEDCKENIDASDDARIDRSERPIERPTTPDYEVLGKTHPVGARKALYGRENIVMTEWGPWDHESPLVRMTSARGNEHVYEFWKMPGDIDVEFTGDGLRHEMRPLKTNPAVREYIVEADGPGVYPYRFTVKARGFEKTVDGAIQSVKWEATFFKWSDVDPRENVEAWRKLAKDENAVSVATDTMDFKYAFGGPSDQKLSKQLTDAKFGGDHFGMIARTKLKLNAGTWKIDTMSDDGIRVTVDGKPIVEDWTWHAPKRNDGTFQLDADRDVEIVVEHFEIDGYATLQFNLSRAD
ncbi:MAG: right-handed parallel beta-helix repeat-containing protein [Phycisphaerales bacterium]|nr:right-handed parallel beta-helix repeat-containing protein [Phycisphaerales bacterium]MCB9863184.1 right-handed parallel beta-helix repeat-containing protein [Phycisphaerales bacterium]